MHVPLTRDCLVKKNPHLKIILIKLNKLNIPMNNTIEREFKINSIILMGKRRKPWKRSF